MVHSKTNRKYDGLQADMRRKERRKKFLAAGLETFGTTGYTKTSIKQLCQIAGLTERYFYESFKNKEDLLCVVYQQLIDEIKNAALYIIENRKGDYDKGIFEAFETFFKWFEDDPRKAKLIFFEVLGVSDRVDRVYREKWLNLFEQNFLFLKCSLCFLLGCLFNRRQLYGICLVRSFPF